MPESTACYITTIKGFADLQPNWDMAQGVPPTEDAIQRALSIIRALDEDHMPCLVGPVPDGGIDMEWCTTNGDELWLSISRDARINYTYAAEGTEDVLTNDAWAAIDDIHAHTIPAICQTVH